MSALECGDAVPKAKPQLAAAQTAPGRRSPEELLLALILLAMAVLPVVEMFLRQLGLGVRSTSALVQHGTLAVCMIGAVVAARRGRLISLATATLLKGRARAMGSFAASAIGATVTLFLAVGSFQFVVTERGDPFWIAQMILPLGFAWITLHLIIVKQDGWVRSMAIAVATALLTFVIVQIGVAPQPAFTVAAFAAIVIGAVLGMPMFATLGGAALVLHWMGEVPIANMAVSHYSLVVNPSLPAIPLFTLAGYILAEGGASRRLVRVFDALFGGVRGGPAIITALACAFFTTFTGGSGVTILALGGLLLPILRDARYSERNALGLLTGAGALGILFPPCLPLILYGISANVEIRRLFIAGAIPGAILVALTIWLGMRQQGIARKRHAFNVREAWNALNTAKWEVLLPVVVLVSLFGGFATPVESAALTALYALAVCYRDYRKRADLQRVFVEAGLLVGGVLLILGVSLGLTSALIDAEIPQLAVQWATANIHSTILFLLLLNLFLIVVGALMDIYSAIVVVVPLIAPLGAAFGVDPLHLGIIFMTNLELGYLMPPVGENLFISAYRFDKPISEVYRACLPMIAIYAAGVIAVTYIPWLTLALVR
jgi:tripartite ATP-independent transporter DctM subunit